MFTNTIADIPIESLVSDILSNSSVTLSSFNDSQLMDLANSLYNGSSFDPNTLVSLFNLSATDLFNGTLMTSLLQPESLVQVLDTDQIVSMIGSIPLPNGTLVNAVQWSEIFGISLTDMFNETLMENLMQPENLLITLGADQIASMIGDFTLPNGTTIGPIQFSEMLGIAVVDLFNQTLVEEQLKSNSHLFDSSNGFSLPSFDTSNIPESRSGLDGKLLDVRVWFII